MDAPAPPLLRKLAWACVLLVLVVTSLSAFIRLSRAGLGCTPWPQCHQQRAALPAAALSALDTPAVTAARAAHRIAATASLLAVIAVLLLALARQPRRRTEGRLALALLALALFLAVLGPLGGAARAPPVVLGNLLGGFAMLALSWRLVQATGSGSTPGAGWRGAVPAALGLVLLHSALGGWTSAGALAGRCDTGLSCQLHGLLAPALLALLLALGVAAWRGGRRPAGAAVTLLALLAGGLGGAQLAGPLSLPLGLAHNVAAALLLAAVAGLLPAR